MLLGQEDLTTGTLANAQKIPPPHKPLPPRPLQPINTHPYSTNLADFVELIQHTPVNFAMNISVPIVIYTHPNTYPTIVNDDQETPNVYHWSKRNLDPQLHSIGSMRDITKSKATKMEILMGKTNRLTHMAPKTKIYP